MQWPHWPLPAAGPEVVAAAEAQDVVAAEDHFFAALQARLATVRDHFFVNTEDKEAQLGPRGVEDQEVAASKDQVVAVQAQEATTSKESTTSKQSPASKESTVSKESTASMAQEAAASKRERIKVDFLSFFMDGSPDATQDQDRAQWWVCTTVLHSFTKLTRLGSFPFVQRCDNVQW
ncbi:hypothetical protein PVAP13_4KG375702 [Panicum virgatum]|uniref:Uncharacterized protein n=1 Tax=Panicum virgatum TaxID=38727 RepID=A0A8T0TPR7_PANVG|nr:hypothetical protein PVAP13_4KG375702 [Panicum virgatum]